LQRSSPRETRKNKSRQFMTIVSRAAFCYGSVSRCSRVLEARLPRASGSASCGLIMLRSVCCALVPVCLVVVACSDSEGGNATPPAGASPAATENPSLQPGSGNQSSPNGPNREGTPEPSATSTSEGTAAVSGVQGATGEGSGLGQGSGSGQSGATPSAGSTPTEATPTETTPTETVPDPTAPTPAGEQNNPTPITPSAGCTLGNASPSTGQQALTIRGAQADYLVTLPAGYNGLDPVPLIFGFHGRNRTHLEFQQVDASQIQTQLGSRAVMVYPKSQGGPGWNFDPEVPPSVEFFDALYEQTLANYCVDTSHVFAVGHSSGGYFSHILACRYGEKLRGIGVVAGQLQEQNCTGNVAAIMIHGPGDTVVPFAGGVAARDTLLARNACSATTAPGPVAPCVSYEGCSAGLPIAWCEHNEPTYQDQGRSTFHGWPSFASQAMASFLFNLP
jgi:polyhydroxybutyrate depolymerase